MPQNLIFRNLLIHHFRYFFFHLISDQHLGIKPLLFIFPNDLLSTQVGVVELCHKLLKKQWFFAHSESLQHVVEHWTTCRHEAYLMFVDLFKYVFKRFLHFQKLTSNYFVSEHLKDLQTKVPPFTRKLSRTESVDKIELQSLNPSISTKHVYEGKIFMRATLKFFPLRSSTILTLVSMSSRDPLMIWEPLIDFWRLGDMVMTFGFW